MKCLFFILPKYNLRTTLDEYKNEPIHYLRVESYADRVLVI